MYNYTQERGDRIHREKQFTIKKSFSWRIAPPFNLILFLSFPATIILNNEIFGLCV
jgi:hypothetical protein